MAAGTTGGGVLASPTQLSISGIGEVPLFIRSLGTFQVP